MKTVQNWWKNRQMNLRNERNYKKKLYKKYLIFNKEVNVLHGERKSFFPPTSCSETNREANGKD